MWIVSLFGSKTIKCSTREILLKVFLLAYKFTANSAMYAQTPFTALVLKIVPGLQ